MDKNYKPNERQQKCKNAFPYMGKEMNKTYCRKLMQERKDLASQNKTFDALDQINKNPVQDILDHWDYLMSKEYVSIGQHPGFLDAELLEQSSLSIERVRDHQMMTSPVIKKLIEDNHVELITYYDLEY